MKLKLKTFFFLIIIVASYVRGKRKINKNGNMYMSCVIWSYVYIFLGSE